MQRLVSWCRVTQAIRTMHTLQDAVHRNDIVMDHAKFSKHVRTRGLLSKSGPPRESHVLLKQVHSRENHQCPRIHPSQGAYPNQTLALTFVLNMRLKHALLPAMSYRLQGWWKPVATKEYTLHIFKIYLTALANMLPRDCQAPDLVVMMTSKMMTRETGDPWGTGGLPRRAHTHMHTARHTSVEGHTGDLISGVLQISTGNRGVPWLGAQRVELRTRCTQHRCRRKRLRNGPVHSIVGGCSSQYRTSNFF